MSRAAYFLAFVYMVASEVPTQVHIALAGKDADGRPDSMDVAWFTQEPTETSTVQYSFNTQNLDRSIASRETAAQYLIEHGYHHHAIIPDIPVGTKVYYRVGDVVSGWSKMFSFAASPIKDATIKMSILGDMGFENSTVRKSIIVAHGLTKTWSASHTKNVLQNLKDEGAIDSIWHVGDIAYADDSFAHQVLSFSYEEAYNGYMNWMQSIAADIPYMVSPGNHESECHGDFCLLENGKYGLPLSNFTAFNKRWHMPGEESGARGNSNMWYSFNHGPVHFVSINTETDFAGAEEEHTGDGHFKKLPAGNFGRPGEYMAWLEADLKAADDARKAGTGRPWIIAGGHRPYEDFANSKDVSALFAKYGVDMYFCGHGHSYSRHQPTSNGTIVTQPNDHVYQKPNGTVLIMSGGAGCDEMAQGDVSVSRVDGGDVTTTTTTSNDLHVVNYMNYSVGVLEANTTTLLWKLYDSITGQEVDQLVILA